MVLIILIEKASPIIRKLLIGHYVLTDIVGTFLASFGKVVDFWFKHDKSKKTESQ